MKSIGVTLQRTYLKKIKLEESEYDYLFKSQIAFLVFIDLIMCASFSYALLNL